MTVATLVQEYPQFVANQVLTQDQLNNMRDFLDHQNRLTRVRMIGIGIVCGLHVRIESGVGTSRRLIISEGYGVTSDGWLIQIEETTYTFIMDYEDPYQTETEDNNHPVYLPWQTAYNKSDYMNDFGLGAGANRSQIPLQRLLTASDPVLPADKEGLVVGDLRNKVLVLYLELDETELKSCFTTDCNNKGQSIKLNVRALLADPEDRFLPSSDCKTLGDLQSVPRFNTGLKMIFGIEMPNVNTVSHLDQTYRELSNYVGGQLKTKVDILFTANEAFFDIQNVGAKISDFDDAINDLLSAPDLGQYHYDFLKDITQAYNELVLHLCEIIEPCCNTEHFPRHLVIKEFGDPPTNSNPAYRHPFYPSPVRNVMYRDYKKAKNLFQRVLNLATSFQINNLGIRITPSQNESYPLAIRAIPFYYQSGIAQIWQLNACCTPPVSGYLINRNEVANLVTTPTPADYLSPLENPLHYDLNACSHLRIEGHIGQTQSSVRDNIIQLRREHNLDFQIISLPLEPRNLNPVAPPDFEVQYMGLESIWVKLYRRIEQNLVDQDEFESVIDQLRVEYIDLANRNMDWCENQLAIELPCDYTAVQSDYSVLRAEFLCFLHRCKPMFNNLPEIEFREEQRIEERTVCLNFENLPLDVQIGIENNSIGEELFNDQGISVRIEEYLPAEEINPDNGFQYGDGEYGEVLGERMIRMSALNLRFDLNPPGLQVNNKEVRFLFVMNTDGNNLSINGSPLGRFSFSEFGDLGPQLLSDLDPVAFADFTEYTLEVISEGIDDITCTGIIRGENINEVMIGGLKNFQLVDFCVTGDVLIGSGGVNPIELPEFAFDARFRRIQLLCDLLENIVAKDILCFNDRLFAKVIKDFTGAAIEIKLLLGCLLFSINGVFRPYRYYPIWNDLEDCFDHISGNCFHARFSTLYSNFRAYWNARIKTFGAFVEKYPGAEHRAGVSKGGTFIMVYQNISNQAVLADFSLEHFVDDCCQCEVELDRIGCPVIALSDYRITVVSDQGSTVEMEIEVTMNDFDLAGSGNLNIGPSEFHGLISDREADLDFGEASNGIIRYKLSDSGQGLILDHFTYQLEGTEDKDIGHVYIAIFPPKQEDTDSGGFTPGDTGKPQGQGTGIVVDAATGGPINGAIVQVFNPRGARAEVITTADLGRFDFITSPDTYKFSISHSNYLSASFEGHVIEDGQSKDFGSFPLSRRNLDALANRFGMREGVLLDVNDALKEEVAFGRANDFVTLTIKDESKPLEEVSTDYETIMAELVEVYKGSDDAAFRKDTAAIMESITHSYMDRAVAHQPKDANEDALLKIENAVGKMKVEGIAVNRILNNWKSNDLRSMLGGQGTPSIAKFRNKFKD